jgi:hypothetical protein
MAQLDNRSDKELKDQLERGEFGPRKAAFAKEILRRRGEAKGKAARSSSGSGAFSPCLLLVGRRSRGFGGNRNCPGPRGNPEPWALGEYKRERRHPMRGILLWLLGVPITVIILLYVFNVL